jgi:predicted kinase
MKKVKELILMVGNIGSGKTTWILRHRKGHQVVMSRDELRYMFGCGDYLFDFDLEGIVKKSTRFIITNLIKNGFSLIVDSTSVSRKQRKELFQFAKKNGYKTTAVVMPKFTMKECVDQRIVNPHGTAKRDVWEKVWQKFDAAYQEVTKDEGVDKIIHVKKWETKTGEYV